MAPRLLLLRRNRRFPDRLIVSHVSSLRSLTSWEASRTCELLFSSGLFRATLPSTPRESPTLHLPSPMVAYILAYFPAPVAGEFSTFLQDETRRFSPEMRRDICAMRPKSARMVSVSRFSGDFQTHRKGPTTPRPRRKRAFKEARRLPDRPRAARRTRAHRALPPPRARVQGRLRARDAAGPQKTGLGPSFQGSMGAVLKTPTLHVSDPRSPRPKD